MLAAFKIIENSKYFNTHRRESRLRGFMRKLSIRASVILLTTIICLSVRTFTDYINIAGAVGSVTVAFIIPEMLYLKSFGEKVSPMKRAGCYFIATFGIVGSAYSILYSIKKMAKGDMS
jgi:amino acid permease